MRQVRNLFKDKPHIFFVLSLVLASVVLIISMALTQSYTYTSDADDELSNVVLDQVSFKIVEYDGSLPSCVTSFSYIPTDSSKLCHVQFSCLQGGRLPSSCMAAQGIITCSEQSSNCISRDEWIQYAEKVCGC